MHEQGVIGMSSDRQKAFSRPKLRLATRDGRPVADAKSYAPPEAIMYVSFQGLTESEQNAALRAFPGGRRFRLVDASTPPTLKYAGR
jgi:hypothetical protein